MEKLKAKIEIDLESCKGCGLCVEACPKDVLALSDETNQNSYSPAEVIKEREGDCIGCGRCAIVCPETRVEVYRN